MQMWDLQYTLSMWLFYIGPKKRALNCRLKEHEGNVIHQNIKTSII